MLDFLLSPPVVPFAVALGLLVGLLLLEIVALLLGATLLGKELGKPGAEAELDAITDAGGVGGGDLDGPGFDGPGFDGPGLGAGLSGAAAAGMPAPADLAQMDLGGLEPADLDLGPAAAGGGAEAAAATGLAAALGLGRVPALIWLAAALAGFGLSGYLLQSLALRFLGAPLPGLAAAVPAAAVALWFARGYGRVLARLIPATETSVRSRASLSRRRGVVSQGTARAGQPAEVRLTDPGGNLHYIRAEPLDRNDSIPQGREVLVLRVLHGPARGEFRIVALGD